MLYSQFTSMPFIPFKMISALTENDNFFKLLFYPNYDALTQPNLTLEQKLNVIWKSQDRMENYNIFLTNVQPNMELESKTIIKCYKYDTVPLNPILSTIAYRFDVLYGTKIPLVEYEGVPCDRGDLIEMEIMKSLNGKDVAGIGFLQFNKGLSKLAGSTVGLGDNMKFTGRAIILATQLSDVDIDSGSCG